MHEFDEVALCVQEGPEGPYGWASIHAHVKEVAILISNHTMRVGDRGVVIVGGSVDLGTPTGNTDRPG